MKRSSSNRTGLTVYAAMLVTSGSWCLAAATVAAEPGDRDADGNWPQFRGTAARGIGSGDPPAEWSVTNGKHMIWKVAVPGFAHASPIVWDNRVFMTTAVSANEARALTGWLGGSGAPAEDKEPWQWKVLCLDARTGKTMWAHTAHEGFPKVKRHIKASHANTTPATDGRHVVAFFGSEGLYCYDTDGRQLWKKDLGVLKSGPYDFPGLEWGFASSPIIFDGHVIVQCDALNQSFWAVFDIRDGREVKRVKRQEVATWSTPTVHVQAGRPQVILNGFKHMGAYDLETGEEIWKMHGGGDVPVPTPFVADDRVVVTNGHNGSPLYIVKTDARGDITPKNDDDTPKGMAWWHPKVGSYMPTPIVVDGRVYVGDDDGILHVGMLATGELVYKQRLGDSGGTYSASPVSAGGRIYFTSEDGDIHVVKAGDEYELLATNHMNDICMATPAIARGRLFVRTQRHLYCIGK